MKTRGWILSFLFFTFTLSLGAQNGIQTTKKLAEQAANNGENKQAISYYKTVYKQTQSDTDFGSLLELYIKTEEFKEAEKLCKKRLKKFPQRIEVNVDLGHVYEEQDKEELAEQSYKNGVKAIDEVSTKTRMLANRFNQYKKYKWVERTYLKARKEGKDERLFQFELANAYAQQGKTDELIEEYLNIISFNKAYLQTVQNLFARVLRPDPEGKQMQALKEKLLSRVQKNPDQLVYSELLIWLYIQDEKFYAAFLQAKALTRRQDENGFRLFKLAQMCTNNQAYETAIASYESIIQLKKSPYLIPSQLKILNVKKTALAKSAKTTISDWENLKTAYEVKLSELGKSSLTYDMIMEMAEIQSYRLLDRQKGIQILEDLISLPGISKQQIAKSKIALADLFLLEDQIWDASLLYSQVEKEFKYDIIGEEAKFKNAKVAFYVGDFNWAQAQLDVLKGSTSKLISNDALDLSLIITDNLGLDSVVDPLAMFARAELWQKKRNFLNANKALDSILFHFPYNGLQDDILYKKYEMALAQFQYDTAAQHLNKIIQNHPTDLLADDAIFRLAQLKEIHLEDAEGAMEMYKKIIIDFPSSLFVVESRKRFRFLRGDHVEPENEQIN